MPRATKKKKPQTPPHLDLRRLDPSQAFNFAYANNAIASLLERALKLPTTPRPSEVGPTVIMAIPDIEGLLEASYKLGMAYRGFPESTHARNKAEEMQEHIIGILNALSSILDGRDSESEEDE